MQLEWYRDLIRSFVNYRTSIEQFDKEFNEAFRKDQDKSSKEVFFILDNLFVSIENYDPECLPGQETSFDISEQELRRCAAEALEKLNALLK